MPSVSGSRPYLTGLDWLWVGPGIIYRRQAGKGCNFCARVNQTLAIVVYQAVMSSTSASPNTLLFVSVLTPSTAPAASPVDLAMISGRTSRKNSRM